MLVEILKEFKYGRDTYYPGEVIKFPEGDNTGEYFCRAGWAKDKEGVVATGNPSSTDVILEVQEVSSSQTTPTLGV